MNPRPFVLRPLVLAGLALSVASCAAGGPGAEIVDSTAQAVSTLQAVTSFGSNPGSLLMYTYVPSGVPANAPVVLALHGCTQTAADYEAAGWDALADTYKFYVVYPQQQSSNNIESCFNWFGNTSGSTADITRGQGEAESVAQMVTYMKSTYSVDAKRVFVTGFSAGAAYAVALLAMYPDVFAAGASFSGVPFGCATTLSSAYTCMDGATTNTPAQWGALAKKGFPGYAGPYPRLSVWQGSADTTVNTANLGEIVQQWANLTGASATATTSGTVNGFPHDEYADGSGVVQVESYSITGMSHAVAIDTASGCGTASTYFVDEKTCAVAYVASFFGLAPSPGGGSSSGSSGGSSSGGSGGSTSSGGSGGSSSSSSGGAGGSSSGAVSADGGTVGTAAASGSGGGGTGDAPDAGPAVAPTMPGCSMVPGDAGAATPVLALVALGIGASLRRRRARAKALTAAALFAGVFTLLFSSPARAQDDDVPSADTPPAGEKTTPKPSSTKPAILGPQGAFYTGAAVSTTPAALLGYFPVDHLATTVGLGFTYDGNGTPTSPLTGIKGATNNRIGSDLFLDVIYFVHDVAPFAMGPELNFIGSLSPNYPMTMVIFTPMWALRYAPWKAPIAIGTGVGMSLAFEKGAKPVASLSTQGLDIVYAF
ncbi:MAG TPA: PHB depolymerase family esterase [Polyangiaceae bacterium]|jgi:poly(hydroxyalkanoate) depolymerase family esterase